MSNGQPIYVFDFDGVICDSTNECLVTSWNAWELLHGGTRFRDSLKDFAPDEIAEFQSLRPRVRGAGEYYVVYQSILEASKICTQNDYDLAVQRHQNSLLQYAKIFYDVRKKLRALNLEAWISLHPIYKEVCSVIDECNKNAKLFIATLKDKESVALILDGCGIQVGDDLIYDAAIIKSKINALQLIQKRLGCQKSDLVFIDDNATHLLEPHKAGYNVYLAAWGQRMPEYVELSKKQGIPILGDQKDLVNLIKAK